MVVEVKHSFSIKIFVSILILSVCSFAAPTVPAASTKRSNLIRLNVERYKLPNGLTVLLHVDKAAPLISYYTWFKVGSVNEEPGYTGIAHLFEHMMFKGAKRYDGKAYDRILGASGGINNAFTTRDSTAYYSVLPSNKLELIVDLESDRMENLQITEENLNSEREVVKEERRYRVENQPTGALGEAIFSTAFRTHNYRWPVIGWMEDINRITVAKCRDFFRTYYAPNNATIVIAGDFNASEAKRLIEKYYGHLASQPIPALKIQQEPIQLVQREARVSKNVQNEHLAITFKTVGANNEDIYALEILSEIMGGGESSRLYKKLVYDKQLASGVSAEHNSLSAMGLFTIYLSLKPGASHDEALQLTYSIIWDARNRPFTDKELQIAKNQVLRQHVEGLKTANGKASALGYNEVVFGSYEHLFKDLEKYDAVTLEDVRKAGAKYLKPEQRNLVVLNRFAPPKLEPEVKPEGQAKKVEEKNAE